MSVISKELPVNPNGLMLVVGPTGSGKSMFETQYIGRQIAKTDHIMITNVPIKWQELQDIICKEYGSEWLEKAPLRDRIYWTENQREIRKFWLCRGFGWYVIDVEEDQYELGYRPDYGVHYRYKEVEVPKDGRTTRKPLYQMRLPAVLALVDSGEVETRDAEDAPEVELVLDEAGSFFPQRSKAKLGEAYRHALEHKRKLRASFMMACQYPNQTDSELRVQANAWVYLACFAHRRKGMFYLPKRSVWQQYPSQPDKHAQADLSGSFEINPEGWGKTYDTSAGTGLAGGHDADSKKKIGGISWLWFFPIVFCAVAAALIFLKTSQGGITGGILWLVGRGNKKAEVAKTPLVPRFPAGVENVGGNGAQFANEIAELRKILESAKSQVQPQEVRDRIGLTGIVPGPKRDRLLFYFVDGSHGSSLDRRFGGVIKEGSQYVGIRFEGREYRLDDQASPRQERNRVNDFNQAGEFLARTK